ncbi:MAG: enoyl-CoA hydratase/isomerase family protein, partial [Proteobacteria bacterium]|nr:enoyl-CoA hydratase/isomerase family protein [Pseudomonadota bacterium]
MLKIEQRNAALIIMIERPEAGNSINMATAAALERAVADAAADPALRTVIITGGGEKYFCTGGDIKEYRAVTERAQLDEVMGCSRRALRALEALEIPVIIAVNGYCFGGGFEMMLAGDIRIASAGAMFALPQARLGIIPGWHGIERLVRLVGRGRTVALAAGGERINAAMAEKFGLIDEVVA